MAENPYLKVQYIWGPDQPTGSGEATNNIWKSQTVTASRGPSQDFPNYGQYTPSYISPNPSNSQYRGSTAPPPPQGRPKPGLYAPSINPPNSQNQAFPASPVHLQCFPSHAHSYTFLNPPNNAPKSISMIVEQLMSPPYDLYDPERQVFTLHKAWAIGIVGKERFDSLGSCHYLCDHQLRDGDSEFGLTNRMRKWLMSKDETVEIGANALPKGKTTPG